jgi:hypothetical protein
MASFIDTDYLEPELDRAPGEATVGWDAQQKALESELDKLTNEEIASLMAANPVATTPAIYEVARNANTEKQGAGQRAGQSSDSASAQ